MILGEELVLSDPRAPTPLDRLAEVDSESVEPRDSAGDWHVCVEVSSVIEDLQAGLDQISQEIINRIVLFRINNFLNHIAKYL